MHGPTMPSTDDHEWRPLLACDSVLRRQLDAHSILWVGAGVSIPAGYPSAGQLIDSMKGQADDPLEGEDLPAVADDFVKSRGGAALRQILQGVFSSPGTVPLFHRAVAILAKHGRIHTLITTNYDDLLERALADAQVRYVVQTLERNFDAVDSSAVRIMKIHGSKDDWSRVICAGTSYAQWDVAYQRLNEQLNVLCTQYPLTFVGSSLCEPRVLGWLAGRTAEERRGMQPWRAFLTRSEWSRLLAYKSGEIRAAEVLVGQFRPVLLDSHEQIASIWMAVAREVKGPESDPHDAPVPPVSLPILRADWPDGPPDNEELEAFLSEARYRADEGLKPVCQVVLSSLEAARQEVHGMAGVSNPSPKDRTRRVALLESIRRLERIQNLVQRSLELLLDYEQRRKTGWGIIESMPLVVQSLLGDDSRRGNVHAWIANNDDQVSSWIYFTREELERIVGHVLSEWETSLSIREFPVPKYIMDLEWSIQDRALGLILRKLIISGRDPFGELDVLRKEKWLLCGD